MAIFFRKKVRFLPFFEGENFRGSRALKLVLSTGIKRSRRDLSKYMLESIFRVREPRKFWPTKKGKILNVLPPYLRFLPFSRSKIFGVPGTQKCFEHGNREISKSSLQNMSRIQFWSPGTPKIFGLENGFFSIFGFREIF